MTLSLASLHFTAFCFIHDADYLRIKKIGQNKTVTELNSKVAEFRLLGEAVHQLSYCHCAFTVPAVDDSFHDDTCREKHGVGLKRRGNSQQGWSQLDTNGT